MCNNNLLRLKGLAMKSSALNLKASSTVVSSSPIGAKRLRVYSHNYLSYIL